MGSGRNQQTSRIDPDQVPRPLFQPEAVREEGGKTYETDKYRVPPSVNAVCTVVDKGNASCEFMRCTVNEVPAYPSVANTSHVPMAVVCQPFAELTPREEPVPLIDYGETGPLRCASPGCRAYVNPHFVWNSAQEVTCNFCGQRMAAPDEFFGIVDHNGRRSDQAARPELCRGTVDYVAPREYSDGPLPGAPVVIFVVDASQPSVQSGFLQQILWTLRSLLGFLPSPSSRVGLITFDAALHFYAFSPKAAEARMVTMADIEDPFVPMGHDALCVDALDVEYRGQFEELLERLPDLLASTAAPEAAGCAALKAAVELAAACGGGHVLMFHAQRPGTGVGALRMRDDIKLYRSPEGTVLFAPQQVAFFNDLSGDCLAKGVAVSAFLAPAAGSYIDVASLSVVPRRTGGEVYFLPGFDPARDGERLHYDLSRAAVQQGAAYSCILKLRCGRGFRVESLLAPWEPEVLDTGTFQVSRMSPDSTATFVVQHTDRVEGLKYAYFQVACLYTDRAGRRLIRVHTMRLPVTSSLSNIFRYTEIDSVTNVLLKQAANVAIKGDTGAKDLLTRSCVDMLHAYRINCASTTAVGQLILPESLKLLPLYVGSIRKMAAFRSGADVRMDDRMATLVRLLGLPITSSAPLVYPRIYPVVPPNEKAGCPTGVGENVYLPNTVASSYDRLRHDAVHLVDTGAALIIHVGNEVSEELLSQAFGVSSALEVPSAVTRCQAGASLSEECDRLFAMVQQIRRDRFRQRWLALSVVVPGTPEESKFLSLLCEDRISGEMLYVDFLCHVHKMVQNKLD